MNNEEEFKRSVKDLLEERSFLYDADNWEEASRILDKNEKRKKRFLFFLFAGVGLGIMLTAFLLLTPKNHATVIISPAGKTKTAPGELAHKEKMQGSKTIKQTQKRLSDKNNSSQKEIRSGTPPVLQTRQQTPVNLSIKPSVASSLPEKPEPTGKDELAASNPLTIKKETGSHSDRSIPEKQSTTSPKQIEDTTTKSSKEKESAADTFTRPSQPEVDTKEQSGLLDTCRSDPSTVAADTLVLAASQPTIEGLHRHVHYFYIEAGTFFNIGWRYQSIKEGAGINPYAGISYYKKFGTKTGLSIGAYYSSLSNLQLGTKTIRESKVVFGEQSSVIAITPHTLNYFLIPLKGYYRISDNQSITVACTIGYLLDVQSKVETYTEALDLQENKKSYVTGGYKAGFKAFNTQLSVGYQIRLYGNLWINCDVLYGLTDLRDNAFFGIKLREKMAGAKVSLIYDLLKK